MATSHFWTIFGFVSVLPIAVSPLLFRSHGRHLLFLAAWFYLLLVVVCWLSAIRQSQFAVHHITQHIGSQVLTDYWTTNNEYVLYGQRYVMTSNGLVSERYPITNELWHVWSIFKK